MDKDYFTAWQLVQYFSLEKEEQSLLIGRIEEHWFIEEDDRNIGANYLIGVCASCLECSIASYYDNQSTREFRDSILAIKDHFEPEYWKFSVLSNSAEWKLARKLAQVCIQELEPILHPLRKPFIIENLIDTDHYAHAKIVRALLKKKK